MLGIIYRVLQKDKKYYPQYNKFLFWHNFADYHIYPDNLIEVFPRRSLWFDKLDDAIFFVLYCKNPIFHNDVMVEKCFVNTNYPFFTAECLKINNRLYKGFTSLKACKEAIDNSRRIYEV